MNDLIFLCCFGNDCIGYYGISKSFINKCLSNDKKVFIINTSWGNDTKKIIQNLLNQYQITVISKFI